MRQTTRIVAAATAALLAATTMATTDDAGLRLRGNSTSSFESVASLSGTNQEIKQEVEDTGYRPFYLQHNILTWLAKNRSGTSPVYLAIPSSPPSAGWTLELDKKNGNLCMRRPEGSSATVASPVGFLVVHSYQPTWVNRSGQECEPEASTASITSDGLGPRIPPECNVPPGQRLPPHCRCMMAPPDAPPPPGCGGGPPPGR